MNKVKVDKVDLLFALRENREKHEAEFNEAYANWKSAVYDAIRDVLEELQGENWDTNLNPAASLPRPAHHLKDYDLAIRMLEMSVEDHIEIEDHEFNQYVMDEWHWKAGFAATASIYNSGR